MYKLFLALKFFFSRKINYISVIGIAAGVWLLTVVPSVMNGFVYEQKTLIRGTLSDIVISPLPTRRLDGTVVQPSEAFEKYEEILKTFPEIEATSPRFSWLAIIGSQKYGNFLLSSSNSQMLSMNVVQVLGVDPEREAKVGKFREYLTNKPLSGGDPVNDPNKPFAIPFEKIPEADRVYAKNAVLFPESLFRELEFEKGERIVLQTMFFKEDADLENAKPSSRKYYIAGSYRTGAYEVDMARVFMTLENAQDFSGSDREFTEIAVKLHDYDHAAKIKLAIRDKLRAAGLPCIVETWEDQKSTLLRAVNNESIILVILLSAVILVAGINIFVILSLMVGYKTRDIGIIGALGGTPGGILATFVGVGFFTGLFGEIIGGTLGFLTVYYLTPFEYFLRDNLGIVIFDPKVYAFDHLPAVFSWVWFVQLLVLTMAACLIASLFPAMRAARLKPVEAIRYE